MAQILSRHPAERGTLLAELCTGPAPCDCQIEKAINLSVEPRDLLRDLWRGEQLPVFGVVVPRLRIPIKPHQ